MATALNVAKYLLERGSREDEPEYLCHMRLQKLLYYTQGWSLALRGRPIFKDRIEAWAHGPVVPEVYRKLKKYGFHSIPIEKVGYAKDLTDADRLHIEAVWSEYKGYSANSLRAMTHKEDPWRDARGDSEPSAKSNARITQASMKRYFSSLASQ